MGVPEMVAPSPPGTIVVPPMTIAPDDSAVMASPPTVYTPGAFVCVGRGMAESPIIKTPDGDKETVVPDRITGVPPGITLEPATLKPVGSAEKVWPPTVKILLGGRGCVGVAGRLAVRLPITRIPDWPRKTGVPEIVIVGLPGSIRESPILNPVGFAVKVLSATVNTFETGVWAC